MDQNNLRLFAKMSHNERSQIRYYFLLQLGRVVDRDG